MRPAGPSLAREVAHVSEGRGARPRHHAEAAEEQVGAGELLGRDELAVPPDVDHPAGDVEPELVPLARGGAAGLALRGRGDVAPGLRDVPAEAAHQIDVARRRRTGGALAGREVDGPVEDVRRLAAEDEAHEGAPALIGPHLGFQGHVAARDRVEGQEGEVEGALVEGAVVGDELTAAALGCQVSPMAAVQPSRSLSL